MVRLSEKMSSMIEEDTKSSSYLSSNKMIYIEVDLDSDDYMCNQFNQYGDEFKELTLNIADTVSSKSQLFQNGTSGINVTKLKSYIHQNNILDQELNSQVCKNSNLDNEIPTMKSYPPNHIFQNKLHQISSSHEKCVSDMKEGSRNKTELLQNNIKTPNMDFCVTDNSKEECYQPKTVFPTDENDEKSVVLSNKSSEKQKVSDIAILSSCINNNCFLSKEIIDIPCSRDSFSQDSAFEDYSSLSSLSVNSTESDTSDLAEQFGNILKISSRKKIVEDEPWQHIEDFNEITLDDNGSDEDDDDDYNVTESDTSDLTEQFGNILKISSRKKIVEDEPWKHIEDFNEITLDDNGNNEDDDDDYNVTKDNEFSDKFSLSQPFWNSRGLKHLQTPEISKDNNNGLTPCKRPFDDGCRCNDSDNFKTSYTSSSSIKSTHMILCHDPSQITSEKRKKTPPEKEKITVNNSENCNISSYVTENLEELKAVYECLDIKFPSDDSTIPSPVHPEACSALNSQSNGCQKLPISDPSFKVTTECYNSKITMEMPYMEQLPNSYQNQMPHTSNPNFIYFPTQVICISSTASQKRNINQQQIDGLTKEDFRKIGGSGTHLHEAAENNNVYLLEALLKQLDKLQFKQHIINFKNDYQQTALHLAVIKNFPSMVHILINHGADVNILAKSCQEDSSKFEAPLHLAASRLKRILVKELLTAKDIDLDIKNSDGQTALHCAVQAPHPAGTDKTFIIKKLIQMKANPSCKIYNHIRYWKTIHSNMSEDI
ncbi:nuclear factor NF-kappa-B p105 subunit-like isoform X2 [Octopus vulgaris]|uniref:Nuclear factor NF-kappa-B p105 subunit-like isoform X2 n=1 Tax=Octopus vulgaris TaxID=6645 RepID=A0AA36F3I7_OCTVU|nr:nuclear factor NF-kappa-B p105 subunit-like isoform X2 [Octopus vulgaris]